MRTKFYNDNDEKFSELINELNNLPKINAPDNFEYNLMVKIENGNLDPLMPRESSIKLSWVITPSAAIITVAVLLFFTVGDKFFEPEINPLMSDPPQRSAGTFELQDFGNSKEFIAKEKTPLKDVSENNSVESTYKVVLQPNDVVTKERINIPFDQNRNVDLDNFNKQGRTARSSAAQLVGGAGTNYFDFNGFFIGEEIDRKILEKFKAKVDSIRETRLKQSK